MFTSLKIIFKTKIFKAKNEKNVLWSLLHMMKQKKYDSDHKKGWKQKRKVYFFS